MDKCPYCGSETRPGDNFCLNCGNRLPASGAAPQQAPETLGETTLAAEENWTPTVRAESNNHDEATVRSENIEVAPATNTIKKPAHLTLRTDSGEVLQEFVLDKLEFTIGRAPNSDILLSKDKLTSRRHAVIRYENGTYILQDERSANGTFVNNQQLEEKAPYHLRNEDRVSIGEYELIFHANAAVEEDIAEMHTVMVATGASEDKTFSTQEDPQMTAAHSDDFGTRPWEGNASQPAESPAAVATKEPEKPINTPLPPVVAPNRPAVVSAPLVETTGVTFSHLTSLPQPQLPDVAPLMAALATLDGQVSALQEQLNSTHEAMRNHEAEIATTTIRLRDGVRHVSDRMDTTIAEVARSREQLAWAELLQLMEDVMNNPRDIEYVTKLARKARELNKVFQIHQSVLNTLAECTSLLRGLMGEERS